MDFLPALLALVAGLLTFAAALVFAVRGGVLSRRIALPVLGFVVALEVLLEAASVRWSADLWRYLPLLLIETVITIAFAPVVVAGGGVVGLVVGALLRRLFAQNPSSRA